eukprot:GILI01011726.1.p1 GENE.GILI01011726.1~~GILI01011726.1.p1  ORF type:complete len:165 (-),score=20.94 GILI01011726.1:69-563(-)
MLQIEEARARSPPILEKRIRNFITYLKAEGTKHAAAVYEGFEGLVKCYVEESLVPFSDINLNEEHLKNLVSCEDLDDLLRGEVNEYVIRKHLRSVVRLYVSEINKTRPINVRDRAQFGFQMESIGLNVGFNTSTEQRTSMPDGNVLVVSVLSFLVVALALFSRR